MRRETHGEDQEAFPSGARLASPWQRAGARCDDVRGGAIACLSCPKGRSLGACCVRWTVWGPNDKESRRNPRPVPEESRAGDAGELEGSEAGPEAPWGTGEGCHRMR